MSIGRAVDRIRPSKAIEQELANAKRRLEQGKTHRQREREGLWDQSQNQYKGHHWTVAESGDATDMDQQLLVVNFSFSTVNTIVPYVTASDPAFAVAPFDGEATVLNARMQQAVLNRTWRAARTGAARAIEDATVDSVIYGDGFAKVGYDMVQRITGEGTAEEHAVPWVRRVRIRDVYIDPLADGLHNARWLAVRLRMTRAELAADKRYQNKGDDNVTYGSDDPMHRDDDGDETMTTGGENDPLELALLWEFYDIRNERMIVFSDNSDIPLRIVEGVRLPYVQIPGWFNPDSPWHIGDLEQVWSLQQELNFTRSEMITHRKRNVAKYVAREKALTDEASTALRSQQVGAVVFVKGDQPLDDIIKPLPMASLQADAYNQYEAAQRDLYEVTGVNEYLRGATPEIRRTATEATIIEGASNVKTQAKLRTVERAVREVGELLLATMAAVYPTTAGDEEALYITGKEAEQIAQAQMAETIEGGGPVPPDLGALAGQTQGVDALVPLRNDIWKGSYEVTVEAASTELRNPSVRKAEMKDMLMTLASLVPVLQPSGVNINWRTLLERWFEAAGINDVADVFEPLAPNPMMGGAPGQAVNQPGQRPAGPPNVPNPAALNSSSTGAFGPA